MRLLKIRRLLKKPDFAVPTKLAGIPLLFLQILPAVLIEPGIPRVVFPIPILGDYRGGNGVRKLLGAARLSSRSLDVEALHPTHGEHLLLRVFLVRGGPEPFDKITAHFCLIE